MNFDNIKVSYSHGSGGIWLGNVLNYCITPDSAWKEEKINWHKTPLKIKCYQSIPMADNVISIGNGPYKYNFWRLYNYKRFLFELKYKRIQGKKIIICPYNTYIDPKDDFFWMINQCMFIQNYNYLGTFQINWHDIFQNPLQVWNTICNFLNYNCLTNYITFNQFNIALANYKKTCNLINFTVNINHKLFLIWCLAFLQNTNELAPFDVYEEFGSTQMTDYILTKKELILDYTNENLLNLKELNI